MSRLPSRPRAPRTRARLLFAVAALALGACDPESRIHDWPDDTRARHPISVGRGKVALTLDVGEGARGLSPRQRGEVRAFAATYHQRGEGPLAILIPTHGVAAPVHTVVRDIRDTLVDLGLPPRSVITVPALPPEPGSEALITLSYTAHVARTNACGHWPDSGVTDPGNLSYYNFGCASQANLAAQVADPRDLASPRSSGPIYATRRQTVLEKYGRGEPTPTPDPNAEKASTSDVADQ